MAIVFRRNILNGMYSIMRIKDFKFFCLLVLLFSFFNSFSSETKFYSVNAKYGISHRESNSICEDNYGFIWSSSKTGIIRLTEDEYHIYHLPYEASNVISVELVYGNSTLLAFTNNGQVFLYDAISDRFNLKVNLLKELNEKHMSITSVLIGDDGVIWFGTTIGIYYYKNNKLTLLGNEKAGFSRIEWYNDHQIFVSKGRSIYLLDLNTLEFETLIDEKSLKGIGVSEFLFDKSQDRLWIGTYSSGLFYFDIKSGVYNEVKIKNIPKQPILALELNNDNSVFIGIDGQGVWEISRSGDRVINVFKESSDNPNSLRGNGVYDIYCDGKNRVWICTYSGGVSYFDQEIPKVRQITHSINNSNSLINNYVNCIIEDSRGYLWFGTDNGISCWDVSKNSWRSFYQNKQEQAQVFLSLCEDNQGRIWAATYSSGVYLLDGISGRQVAHYSRDEADSLFSTDYIFNIYKDRQGNIWIGGVNTEVICYNPIKNVFRKYSNLPLNAFSEFSSEKMILGCASGLFLIDKISGELKSLIDGTLVQDVLVIGDNIWVCTSGDGLICYNIKSGDKKSFTIESGLPSNFVNSILDYGGFLWLGTENGLCKFNPVDNSVLTYTSISALSNFSYNRNSNFRLRDGQLAWGTSNGAIIFDPNALRTINNEGRIFIQDLSISGRSIRNFPGMKLTTPLDSLKEITLKHNQNTISMELLPIGVASGSKFSWKMEGLDKEWNQPSTHRIITYTNIPGRDFDLKIKMYNSSLSEIIDERTIKLKMIPPFWKTWWFLTITFVALSSIFYLYLWYYINNLKRVHSEEKIRFFANTAHDIRTSLTLINAPIEEINKEPNLSDKVHYFLNLAIEQTRRLSSISTQLLDFQKTDSGKGQLSLSMVDIVKLISLRIIMFESYAKSKDIELVFSSDKDSFMTAVDEALIEKIVDNLISNAIKYSNPKYKVYLRLECNKKNWVLEVKDQGIGISDKAQRKLFKEFYRAENAVNSKIVGSGIGLMLVKNYVSMHGGEVTYFSQENEGSTFRVIIPYKNVEGKLSENSSIIKEVSNFDSISEYGIGVPVSHGDIKILIVEDNEDLSKFMEKSLSDEFQIEVVADGVLAWDYVQGKLPDLIISDVMMPNMDGFELCKRLKSTFETSHIPLILLTALSEKDEQLKGLGLGADDYLTKPFDMSLLRQRIRTIIRNREFVRERAIKYFSGENKEPIFINELNDSFTKKAVEIIRENISNTNFLKDEFAREMNVSPSLLYKKIKSLTGQSPNDLIKVIRLNYSKELLINHKYSVTEVSELSGFGSIGYFSTVFKKHFGKSPTDFTD